VLQASPATGVPIASASVGRKLSAGQLRAIWRWRGWRRCRRKFAGSLLRSVRRANSWIMPTMLLQRLQRHDPFIRKGCKQMAPVTVGRAGR
ncbi:unnamed protein product, partial [Symbiodinium microadriaticum]